MAEMHDKFMKTAFLFSDESKCVSFHVGAVIVKDKRIVSIGYNGTPPGLPNCCDVFDKDDFDPAAHTAWQKKNEIHAEMNAILQAANYGIEISGATLYANCHPCSLCAKMLINVEVKKIVVVGDYPDKLAEDMLKEAGIDVEKIKT